MNRREMLTGTAAGLLAAAAPADDGTGPFALPSVRFKPAAQHELPPNAFELPLPIPLAARPTAIGTYKELAEVEAFGPGDPRPIGEVFHGVALEWGVTPEHWAAYGCDPKLTGLAAWDDKTKHFGTFANHDPKGKPISNWGGFKIKCFKVPIQEGLFQLRKDVASKARMYSYAGMVPGPTLKMRLGQPVVVRFENHLEAETSVHLHGGHSPSHSDGFPSFYVLQGKSRDYFYPNILPLHRDAADPKAPKYEPDAGESQSTMWYHDHAMDATAYNVSKGLAGLAPCFGENELALLYNRVLPGLGPLSCDDPERDGLKLKDGVPDPAMEDPAFPGFYKRRLGCEPYFNPYDIPLVLQDKVIDPRTGQIAYDNTGHNGYLGDTFLVNGAGWPKLEVRNRKYRFRVLDGSNARVFRLRLLREDHFTRANRDGIDTVVTDDDVATNDGKPRAGAYDRPDVAQPFLRIGKDSWLWSEAVEKTSVVLAMANRADLVVDFGELAKRVLKRDMRPGDEVSFVLVNTMPQTDGRGPKSKLDDGGDPRVLPLPFDTQEAKLVDLDRPIGLMKIVVKYGPPGSQPDDPKDDKEASVKAGTKLLTGTYRHRPIPDNHVKAVRLFRFERGKGAWMVNKRFYDPTISNACPIVDEAEEWILENGGGGWWHPIHIHLESHQIVRYEKDFAADAVVDRADPPAQPALGTTTDVTAQMDPTEVAGFHDTQLLGPNTRVRIRMRHRTWSGPFVFHCHNLEHEDMRMMFNFEPVPKPHDPNVVPDARTHGNALTLGDKVGELPWEFPLVPAVPQAPAKDAGVNVVPPRPAKNKKADPPPA